MSTTLVAVEGKGSNPKTTLYVGGLEESVNESSLHAAFIPYGDIRDVNIPMDHASGKHRSAGGACMHAYLHACMRSAWPLLIAWADSCSQSHCLPRRGFGFVEYEEKEDAAAAIDNMHNAELFGRVLKVNFAQPMKIKGGDKGWSHQAVWADADKYIEVRRLALCATVGSVMRTC
jgi:peptidyl-prolyl isomerase E (cyclophilin E)